jgi:hypothetical protein
MSTSTARLRAVGGPAVGFLGEAMGLKNYNPGIGSAGAAAAGSRPYFMNFPYENKKRRECGA